MKWTLDHCIIKDLFLTNVFQVLKMLNIFGTATCLNTNFVTGKGSDINQLPLKEFHDSLGIDVCNALPGFHALSGANIADSFCGKGEKS